MKIRTGFPLSILFAIALSASIVSAQEGPKRPLDHSVYDDWNRLQGQALSADGKFVLYTLAPQDGGDVRLRIMNLVNGAEHVILNGTQARFTADSRYAVYLIEPTEAEMDEAEEADLKPAEQPKRRLLILGLGTDETDNIPRVRSFQLPADSGRYLAFLMEAPVPVESDEPEEEPAADEAAGDTPRKRGNPGTELILRDLQNGSETSFAHVTGYQLSDDGDLLIFATRTPTGETDGIYAVETGSGSVTTLLTGDGSYERITLSEDGAHVAFLFNPDEADDDEADEDEAVTLYHWAAGSSSAESVAADDSPGIPEGWAVSGNGSLSFSRNGGRLFFGTAPIRDTEPVIEEDSEESEVVLDIWHWQDTRLQPQQLLEIRQDERRNYQAVVHLESGRIVQLADEGMPRVNIGQHGNAPTGLATTSVPYENPVSWEYPSLSDVYLVDIATGDRKLVMKGVQRQVSMSPGGNYLVWWDYQKQQWFSTDLETMESLQISAGISHPLYNELHDTPMPASSYGNAGWTENDESYVIYDAFDLWALDPTGESPARSITEGKGRENGLRYRYVRLDREADTIDPRERMLLSTFDTRTKASGFSRDRVQGRNEPELLMLDDYSFSNPVKAEDSDILLLTRQSYIEFPDLWTTGPQFGDWRKVSDANPQQDEYLWGTAELVHWISVDGRPHDGILYKPDDFDPAKQYPMMVTFYEKNSDNLHTHWMPEPHRSIINYTFYTSRGYLVFLPDIHYTDGYPGESAMDSIIPGVHMLIAEGFVDADNIGTAGHSWGGYQIAYMVTKTNLFKAAEAGAPVSNMFSAYGGIRWASGLSRSFQYEWTQSRIGGTIWEMPFRYIENSPIFWADKVETPLLIMHNDEDGAVPWEQGIELFVALRRLQKPVWMITYNEQPHWPITWPNKKDWAVRLQQYFDHFLMGAPAPLWISEGVPAIDKGRTLGREIPPK
ncbi:prolyl oligopeptidase family serine peptidase [Candidatus Zixiibacteriota bacterium]